jgi:O-acetyl-ADP-ribose deacetylase (regulator of RNase III)
MTITYVRGDATNPLGPGNKIIVHCCNDQGGWGKGFVLALSRKWSAPEEAYRRWYRERDGFGLGQVQLVQVEPVIWVANLIGQHGTRTGSKGPPIRYAALRDGLGKLADGALRLEASIHGPRLGCGLAGGKWEVVAPIIEETLCQAGLAVTVYDYEG